MAPRLFQVRNNRVSPAQNSILQAVPSNEDIRNSVFNLKRSSLFILVKEVLSLNIDNLASHKYVTPIYSAPASPSIHHLMFADDILLFFKAIPQSIKAIKEVLEAYQLAAGQDFNLRKSHVLFGNSKQSFKVRVSRSLGISQAFFPAK
ncbi:hypothetical protein AAC387_Pa03g0541 [Persea americana]